MSIAEESLPKINAWTDASFRSDEELYIGAGAVLGQIKTSKILLLLACDMTALGLRDNNFAELWASTFIVGMINQINEDMGSSESPFQLNALFTDSEYVMRWSNPKTKEKGWNTPDSTLLDFFRQANAQHPDMKYEQLPRKNKKIKIADRMAYHGARRDYNELQKHALRHKVPCAFSTVEKDGTLTSEIFVPTF